jgi:SulP family sulfate permease
VLDCETVPFVDISAAEMMLRLASDLERRGVRLALARVIGQVRDVLNASGGDFPALAIHPSIEAALAAVQPRAPGSE